LKVGKCNALSDNTAAGHVWKSTIAPLSAWPCGRRRRRRPHENIKVCRVTVNLASKETVNTCAAASTANVKKRKRRG
jgi:hypothetical protein